jgi:E3 ubiquitin-protein ligase DOA10
VHTISVFSQLLHLFSCSPTHGCKTILLSIFLKALSTYPIVRVVVPLSLCKKFCTNKHSAAANLFVIFVVYIPPKKSPSLSLCFMDPSAI